ncbi:SigE family RNA polymerase sigma factor [Modestobacter sp. SSW1-42]|uniref:SigE family RNA polymerase sigma factor n=1 Tax=Modestobacter sp. SSW1-42 TaxID=596372 RepID=UPI00398795FE
MGEYRDRWREGARSLDDDEFTAFARSENAALMRTAWLLTGDRGLAEDLVQSALTRAYGKWSRVQRADDRSAYVHRLMINTHLNWRRRLTNTETVVESVPDRSTADHQADHAARDEMRTALAQLSPRVRTAVVLRYFEDRSEAETAQLMRCSVSTVNSHVTRGLSVLRGLLAQPSPDDLSTLSRRRP